jgi:hypothetical protein
MDLKLDIPHYGWLPLSITIFERQYQFGASNVVNDPLSEFLAVALWLVAPHEPLPDIGPNLNPPFTDDDVRGVHFWLEPVWHTLLVQRLQNRTHVRLLFHEDHEGGLFVGPDDFRYSELTLFDRISVSRFVHMISTSLASIRNNMSTQLYDRHWRHPFSDAHLRILATHLPPA